MEKEMVECEDGRIRQARFWGTPAEEGNFEIFQASIRVKGRHVSGEAWHSRKTGIWYFLTSIDGKNNFLLPRRKERPDEKSTKLLRSPTIRKPASGSSQCA